jgi:hypothetical protein
MTGALRAVAALGGLALAASFFVPWSDHRSPVRQFMAWTVESDFSADDRAALVFSIGVAVAIAYPYVWALVAAAGAWWSEHRRAGLWGSSRATSPAAARWRGWASRCASGVTRGCRRRRSRPPSPRRSS